MAPSPLLSVFLFCDDGHGQEKHWQCGGDALLPSISVPGRVRIEVRVDVSIFQTLFKLKTTGLKSLPL